MVHSRWLAPRALVLHATILVVVPAFMVLCTWQVRRALSGNDLSWAYVFEWPFFAGYAVYMWWRLLHEGMEECTHESTDATVHEARAVDEPGGEDAELEAYNRYLAELEVSGRPKRW